MKKRIHQIELFKKYPIEVQNEWRDQLVKRASDTLYGRTHGFDRIDSRKSFESQIPLNDYETLRKHIEQTKLGAANVLWPGEIKWFAKSSGTTGSKSKYIPVSKESLEECHYKGGKDLISIYYNHFDESRLFTGKGLALGGSREIDEFNTGSYSGDLSAVIIKNLPFWVELHRTPNRDIALIAEWEDKLEKIARISIEQDITEITGVPSWTLVLLRRVLAITGKSSISEIWPNLELYVHGGVSFTPYQAQFDQVIGKKINYLETYNASEGFFGIQDQFDSDDKSMLLMLDYGIYYEFIKQDQWHLDEPVITPLEEVEKGESYEVVITTNGGLWRYRIGDVVTFTSTYPFRIKVSGRTKFHLNSFGEELMVHNVDLALKAVAKGMAFQLTDYTACPIFMSDKQGGHEWIFEFEDEPEDKELFVEAFDGELQKVNSDYEAKRYKNFILQMPKVHFVPKGTFHRWLKAKGKLGGQNKVPRLWNERTYVDEILSLD